MNKVFGYVRVSSAEQNLDRQIEAILKFAKDNNINLDIRDIIQDKKSGKDTDRPGYQGLKNNVRSGDTIIIKELDRLGRNKEQIHEELKYFKDNNVRVMILNIPTTLMKFEDEGTAKAMLEMINNILIEVLGTIAEEERKKIKERQTEGIQVMPIVNGKKVSKKTGRPTGRPNAEYPSNWNEVYTSWKNGSIKGNEAMEQLGLKRTTFYKLIKQFENK